MKMNKLISYFLNELDLPPLKILDFVISEKLDDLWLKSEEFLSKTDHAISTTSNISIPTFNFNISSNLSSILDTNLIHKIPPLISDYHYNNIVRSITHVPQVSSVQVENAFRFHMSLNSDNLIFNAQLSHVLTAIFLLSVLPYLMQKVCWVVCGNRKPFFKVYKTKWPAISFCLFNDTYNYIISRSSWIYNYLYKLSYKKLYTSILLNIYNNIKGLIPRLDLNYELTPNNRSKKLSRLTYNRPVFSINGVIMFAGSYLNVIYATLTVVYIILGWILDFLSFIWLFSDNAMHFKYIWTIVFWYKHLLYAVLYILWLYTGVITTNGIYFSIRNSSNIVMLVLGSIMSYIFSNLWYYFAQATLPQTLLLRRWVRYVHALLLSRQVSETLDIINRIFSRVLHWFVTPIYFNFYSTFRRSIFEWLAFLGMVFSTYGSWNIYYLNVFNRLLPLYHFLIWSVPTIFSGYGLVYVEEVRPRFGHFFYGFIYLMFWTSICFATNSILAGYFNVSNASTALLYFIPINVIVAFIYPLPLYRASLDVRSHPSFIHSLFHLLLFILLTAITLISAGLIWYIIG